MNSLHQKDAILYLSSYPPRMCGIANFTKDLTNFFDRFFGSQLDSKIIALNEDFNDFYAYNDKVENILVSSDLKEYEKMAKYVNNRKDVLGVMVEHEFGLFGGEYGNYLLEFLKRVDKKIFVTLHTVLPNPEKEMKRVLRHIAKYSTALVVMNKISGSVLEKVYNIEPKKIYFIPHGIPHLEFESSKKVNKTKDLKDKTVLLTFGLLSPNKGIEYTINALPKIIDKYPDLIFVLVGKTHPGVVKKEGEKYRNFLKKRISKLKLEKNVIFYDQYCSLKELLIYLKMTDIYVSSSLDPNQSVSGTVSYAIGAGRPVISTKNEYAKFIINDSNGILVPFKDSESISNAVLKLLEDKDLCKKMSVSAYKNSRIMIWPNVARAYFNLYDNFLDLKRREYILPEFKLDYLEKLTDSFGVLQFAKFADPDKKSGHTLDDNARALLLCTKAYIRNPSDNLKEMLYCYLNFIEDVSKDDGFFNIVNSKKEYEELNRDDAIGRLLMSLGYVLSKEELPVEIFNRSHSIFKKVLKHLDNIKSPRAIAFSIIGISYYLKSTKNSFLKKKIITMSEELVHLYEACSSKEWQWFEEIVSYSNAILPKALFMSYKITKQKSFLRVAKKTLNFLIDNSFKEDKYLPIGQNGWFVKGSQPNSFDQQPEEISTMVLSLVKAYEITSEERYKDYAIEAFEWFLGKNHLGQMVYDEVSGGCYDGLGKNSLNFNQGSESTVMYLLARLAIQKVMC
jgi:glycosyltransferase involved in cell wall biosynthesis